MSTSSETSIQIALLSVRQSQLRAEMYAARINTGIYKNRIVHHGSIDGPLYSEQELLKEEVATMNRHIQLAEDKIEFIQQLLSET